MPAAARVKSSLRVAQKDITRRRIRSAARELFISRPFEDVSMEEVANDAGVGRTTIYFHYPTKNALLLDLLGEDWERQAFIFARLAASPALDRETLRGWLKKYTDGMRRSRNLFRMYIFALSLHEDFARMLHAHRERLIVLLGEKIPAFTPRTGASPDKLRAAAASHAMINHIEHYGGLAVAPDTSPEDVEAAADVLLDDFERFIESAHG
jgi:AcrR family transcriptional regulator